MDNEFDKASVLAALGRHIAKMRRSKGYSQDRLALEGSFSRGTVSKIEAGKVDPKASTIIRISEILGISPGKLIDFKKS